MKKFLLAAALIVGVVASQLVTMSQASAQDYYVGTYSDGTKGYFMSETYESLHMGKYSADFMKCYVKVMDGNQILGYRPYFIKAMSGWVYAHKQDAPPMQWRSTDSDPIANKVKNHCINMSTYGYTYDR